MFIAIASAGFVVVGCLAFFLGRAIGASNAKSASQQETQAVRDQLAESSKRLAVAEAGLATYGDVEKRFRETFAALASPALEQNSRQFLDLAEIRFKNLQSDTRAELEQRKSAIETLVAPLGKSLDDLSSKVSDLELKRVKAYAEVTTQISTLGDVNKELRTQTGNLVQALRSPNVRGNWGQMQLRRTVEIAGLLDQCDFFEQVSEDTDTGRLTPDMVVHLPGGRRIVVDAKAPEINLDGLETSTEEQRAQYLKNLAGKVRDHINQLSAKKYREQFEPTPEFVVMFLPGEALFTSALQHDLSLLEYGVSRKVMLASPLTLIALLHAVNYGWKQQSLAHDAAEIRDLGRELHDSVRVLAEHMVKMRDHLEGTVEAFNASIGSVERNFLSKARKFKELNAAGAEEIQEIDSIDERLRAVDAPELRQAAAGGTPLFDVVIEKLTETGS